MQQLVISIYYALLLLFSIILLATTYVDIRWRGSLKRYARIKRFKSVVGIVIISDNKEPTIEALLKQCLGLRLKLKIVVIDNKSSDNSVAIIKDLLKRRAKSTVTAIYKTKKSGRQQALLQAAKKLESCEYIISLDGGNLIDGRAITFLRQYIEAEQPESPLVVPASADYRHDLAGMWWLLVHASKNIVLKAASLTMAGSYSSSNVAVYPRKVLSQKIKPKFSTKLLRYSPLIKSTHEQVFGPAFIIFFIAWSLITVYSVHSMLFYQNSLLMFLLFLLFFTWNSLATSYISTLSLKQKFLQSCLSPLLFMLTSVFWPLLLHQSKSTQSVKK